MKTTSFSFLGLLVVTALLASFSVKPAAAQCDHTKPFFNPRTMCCGCKFNMIFNTVCMANDCNDCPQMRCTTNRHGVVGQGALLPESSLQCSLGHDAWSHLAGQTAPLPIEVVKLKARS